jgi:hypothetical protein
MAPPTNDLEQDPRAANTPSARCMRDESGPPHDQQACARTPKLACTGMAISLQQPAGSKDTSDRHAFCARTAADGPQTVMAPSHRVSGELAVGNARAAFPKSRTTLVVTALASAHLSRGERPAYRCIFKKSLLFVRALKPAGRGARGRCVPGYQDAQARRVVRSHWNTHGASYRHHFRWQMDTNQHGAHAVPAQGSGNLYPTCQRVRATAFAQIASKSDDVSSIHFLTHGG